MEQEREPMKKRWEPDFAECSHKATNQNAPPKVQPSLSTRLLRSKHTIFNLFYRDIDHKIRGFRRFER